MKNYKYSDHSVFHAFSKLQLSTPFIILVGQIREANGIRLNYFWNLSKIPSTNGYNHILLKTLFQPNHQFIFITFAIKNLRWYHHQLSSKPSQLWNLSRSWIIYHFPTHKVFAFYVNDDCNWYFCPQIITPQEATFICGRFSWALFILKRSFEIWYSLFSCCT